MLRRNGSRLSLPSFFRAKPAPANGRTNRSRRFGTYARSCCAPCAPYPNRAQSLRERFQRRRRCLALHAGRRPELAWSKPPAERVVLTCEKRRESTRGLEASRIPSVAGCTATTGTDFSLEKFIPCFAAQIPFSGIPSIFPCPGGVPSATWFHAFCECFFFMLPVQLGFFRP